MTLKITQADKWFSKCIREAQNYTCEVCGKSYPSNSMGLHCSHYFGRRNYSVRFCGGGADGVTNTFCHCFGCHQRLGSNPYDFTKWVTDTIGEGALEMLIEKRNDINAAKMIKKNLKDVAAHYKLEFEGLQARRAGGDSGILTFNSYL